MADRDEMDGVVVVSVIFVLYELLEFDAAVSEQKALWAQIEGHRLFHP